MLVTALVLPLLGRVFQGTATTSDELDELLKDMNTAALASISDEQLAGRGFDAGVVQSVRDAIWPGRRIALETAIKGLAGQRLTRNIRCSAS